MLFGVRGRGHTSGAPARIEASKSATIELSTHLSSCEPMGEWVTPVLQTLCCTTRSAPIHHLLINTNDAMTCVRLHSPNASHIGKMESQIHHTMHELPPLTFWVFFSCGRQISHGYTNRQHVMCYLVVACRITVGPKMCLLLLPATYTPPPPHTHPCTHTTSC